MILFKQTFEGYKSSFCSILSPPKILSKKMMSSKNTFFLLYLFLFIFDITVNGYDKTFECSLANTPSYILEANTVTLFQTPEFPKNINNSVFSSSCNANFTASAGDTVCL